MAAEIVAAIPEYAPLLEGPNARVITIGIEQSIATFVDRVAAPTASAALRDDLCRQFGRFEAYEGRSLDNLQAAYRIGCQVALRRVRTVGRRYSLSAGFMLTFADALFAYMGDLAELSREGYVQALAELGEEPDNRRRRLLRRILGGTAVARGALAELAEHCAWPLPEEVTLVALAPGTRPERGALDRDVLQDTADPEPHLLVPGPFTEQRAASLARALAGGRAAVGLTTVLGEAADSLRWARHTLALSDAGVLDRRDGSGGTGTRTGDNGTRNDGTGCAARTHDFRGRDAGAGPAPGSANADTGTDRGTDAGTDRGPDTGTDAGDAPAPLVRSEDHLLPLWLLGDPALADQMARRYLGPLTGMTAAQRARLLDTLRVWLTTRGTATQVAALLGVHPQTVRYRLRLLDRALGDRLAAPDDRFAAEIALRALHLREGAGNGRAFRDALGPHGPRGLRGLRGRRAVPPGSGRPSGNMRTG